MNLPRFDEGSATMIIVTSDEAVRASDPVRTAALVPRKLLSTTCRRQAARSVCLSPSSVSPSQATGSGKPASSIGGHQIGLPLNDVTQQSPRRLGDSQ